MSKKKKPPETLEFEVTAEDYRRADEVAAKSAMSHCFRCLTPKPPDDSEWGTLLFNADPDPAKHQFLENCPDCFEAIEDWLCGNHDEILGEPPPL
jgi:hypothetical protein